MKYKLKPGFTKESVMAQVKKYNNDSKALDKTHPACVYQTKKGNRCAIGCFIPDGHPGLGHVGGVPSLLQKFPDLKSYMPFYHEDALQRLQTAHDDCDSRTSIYDSVQRFLDAEVKEDQT